MKVDIDKNCIKQIKDFTEFEYIYIFDNTEKLEDLLKLGLHCMHKDIATDMDINLTNYKIGAFKKANINEPYWYKMPEKKAYKYTSTIGSSNVATSNLTS